jgi:hypothetical protein
MRAPYYELLNRLVDLRVSPWPTIILQSLLTAWTIRRFASTVFGITGAVRLLSLAVFLALGTSLPWFVGWMMPDIFTPLMIIALALLYFTSDDLSRWPRVFLVLLVATALAVHQANLPAALWALPALGSCALLGWRPTWANCRNLAASGIGLGLGIAALLVVNLAAGRFALSNGGSVFLLARLLGDGTALRYLEQVCPQQHFAVCTDLGALKSYYARHPDTLDSHFLWGGPLDRLGGFRAEQAEAAKIVANTLSTYPLAQLRASAANAWHQVLRFATGAELAPYSDTSPASIGIRAAFGPAVYSRYRRSAQIRGVLAFLWLDRIHLAVVILSSVLVGGFVAVADVRRSPQSVYATLFVTIMVVGNAITMGVLSGPYPRYQARVIWLVPLLAACFLLAPRTVGSAAAGGLGGGS